MNVKTYRAKPVTVQAIRWTGDNFDEIKEFCNGMAHLRKNSCDGYSLFIETMQGTVEAHPQMKRKHEKLTRPGDMIVCGVQGEFYPVEPNIFAAKYEEVDE